MMKDTWRDFAGTGEGKALPACGIKGTSSDSNKEAADATREGVRRDGNGRSAKIEAKRRVDSASSA